MTWLESRHLAGGGGGGGLAPSAHVATPPLGRCRLGGGWNGRIFIPTVLKWQWGVRELHFHMKIMI